MASRIQGITVEIGGDTTKLTDALSQVNKEIKDTQSQLKDVEKLLKLDPNNVVLLAQKQAILTDAVEQTTRKLEQLEGAQEQVNAAFQKGDISKDQYMAFQREIEETKASIQNYQNALGGMEKEQEALARNTERLNKLFSATGTSVDDYADTLGSRLANAIRTGTANSEQLRSAIEKIGKAATDGKADIGKINEALDQVDNGEALRQLISQLEETGDAAEQTAGQIEEIGETLNSGVLMEAADKLSVVGDKIKGIGEKAIESYADAENAAVKASSYFGETGEAAERTGQAIQNVFNTGVGDSMDAVADAVIVVKKNLGELSDTDLTNLTQQALKLDELYGIDMNETLRGVNSLMKQYGLTAQEAMDYIVTGTQNGLDKTNELGDNLSEYAGKFSQAGYSASEYFQLLQNGLAGGAYNLDKVNDAINEVTTRIADGTIGDSIDLYSEKTQGLFLAWQNGEATQKQVIDSIVADIGGCTSQQEALNMAAQAFGTMAEDGNLRFITSLTSVGQAYDSVSGSAKNFLESSTTPMQTLEGNIRQLQATLQPLGEKLLEIANTILPPLVAGIQMAADFIGALPEPVQNFILILGGLIVAFTALAPVIAAVAAATTALNVSLLPIIGIITAVAAAIAVIIAVIQNWGAITQWLGTVWDAIKVKCSEVWNGIKDFFSQLWESIRQTLSDAWTAIANFFSEIWTAISGTAQNIWNGIKEFFSVLWESIRALFQTVLETISTIISTYFEIYRTVITTVLNVIKTVFVTVWDAIKQVVTTVVSAIQEFLTAAWNTIKTVIETVLSAISSIVSAVWNGIREIVTTVMNTVSNTVSSIWNGIRNTVSSILNAIKNTVSNIFNSIVGGISNAMGKVYQAVVDGFNQAVNFITGLASSAFSWGYDLISGIVNGIRSCIGNVVDAVADVANAIRSYLHFSVPDVGPLTDYESWMPDFMRGLAKGIWRSKKMVQKAVSGVAEDMVVSPRLSVMQNTQKQVTSMDSIRQMVSGMQEVFAGMKNGNSIGTICIPVYIGGTLLDEVIVNAQARQNLKSGGR